MNHNKEDDLNQHGREGIKPSTKGVDNNVGSADNDSIASKSEAFQKLLDSGMADAISRRASRPLSYDFTTHKPRPGTKEVEQNPWDKPQESAAQSTKAPEAHAEPVAEVEDVPQALTDEPAQMAEEPANNEPAQIEEPVAEMTDFITAPLETPVEEIPNLVKAHKEERQVQENKNEDFEPQTAYADTQNVSDSHQKKHIEVTPLGAGLLGIVEEAARGVGGLGSGCARWLKKNGPTKCRKSDDSDISEQGIEEDYPWREDRPQTDNLDRSASSAARVTEMVAASVMSVGTGVSAVAGYVARGAVEGPVDIFRYTWKTVAGVTGVVASRLGARKGDSEE